MYWLQISLPGKRTTADQIKIFYTDAPTWQEINTKTTTNLEIQQLHFTRRRYFFCSNFQYQSVLQILLIRLTHKAAKHHAGASAMNIDHDQTTQNVLSERSHYTKCAVWSLFALSNMVFILLLKLTLKLQYSIFFNPFQNNPLFLCVCNISLKKTLWEEKKLLAMSNFSFTHGLFCPFGELSPILSNLPFLSANSFSLEYSKSFYSGRKFLFHLFSSSMDV